MVVGIEREHGPIAQNGHERKLAKVRSEGRARGPLEVSDRFEIATSVFGVYIARSTMEANQMADIRSRIEDRIEDGSLQWVNGMVRTLDESRLPSLLDPGQVAINPRLGLGVLSLDGDIKAPAVTPPTEATEVSARYTQWQIRKVETLEELRTTLSIGAAATYSDVGLELNASASLYREVSLETYTLVILVRCVHTTVEQTFRPVEINVVPDLENLATQGVIDAIGRKYGDSYINSVLYGGEYLAYINLSTSNQTEYERVTAAASGSYGSFGGSGDFESSMQYLKKITKLSGTQIIKGVTSPVPSWNQVESYALNFPALVEQVDQAVPTLYGIEKLEETANWPAVTQLDYRKEERRIETLLETLLQCKLLRSSWDFISTHPQQFVGAAPTDAKAHADALKIIEGAINHEVKDIKYDIGKYIPPSPLPAYDLSSHKQLPIRMGVLRPQLRGSWIERFPSSAVCPPPTYTEEITNYHDTSNTGLDWIRSPSGHATIIYALGVQCIQEIPGVELWMRLRAGTPNPKDSPWVPASTLRHTEADWFLTGVAFQLRGPMADQYVIDYMVHCNDVGNSEYRCGNAPGCLRPAGEFCERGLWAIQGFRLVIYPG